MRDYLYVRLTVAIQDDSSWLIQARNTHKTLHIFHFMKVEEVYCLVLFCKSVQVLILDLPSHSGELFKVMIRYK